MGDWTSPNQPKTSIDQLKDQLISVEKADAIYGCYRVDTLGTYRGWLYNLYETVLLREVGDSRGLSNTPTLFYSAVECYFFTTTLDVFKVAIPVQPYFYICAPAENYTFIQERLSIHYPEIPIDMVLVERNDLTARNHISSEGAVHLRLVFKNMTDMRSVSSTLNSFLRQRELSSSSEIYNSAGTARITANTDVRSIPRTLRTLADYIDNVLEHDINLTVRFLVDNRLTLSTWYEVTVKPEPEPPLIERLTGKEFELPPVPKVLAYDIETTKKPLRFPNAELGDQIMCISYMFDDQGYLLINRSIFSQDIADFDYTPKQEFQGRFACFNLPTEKDVLVFFFNHIRMGKPNIFVTFNGDFFDWPFVEVRAAAYGMSLLEEIGVIKSESTSRAKILEKQYYARAVPHLDCFRWVRRDSYLPQGSHGLKAVTRIKLKYHPDELSPELMVSYAQTDPQVLASYSVSDAVATYYLYKKYVHPFIFALGTIIPLNPDDILRRGTGTLCEHLLMVEAYDANVPFPNKHRDPLLQVVLDSNHEKRILINQTYVGGKVEAINAGVYRNDIYYDFEYYSSNFKQKRTEGYGYLLRHIDRDLVMQLAMSKLCTEEDPSYQHAIGLVNTIKLTQTVLENISNKDSPADSKSSELCVHITPDKNVVWFPFLDNQGNTQHKMVFKDRLRDLCAHVDELVRYIEATICSNYSDVRNSIARALVSCNTVTHSKPLLYHLDVAAMYPNIMLTNKLQPTAIVDPQTICSSCDYSTIKEARVCQRMMDWDWRGSYYPIDYSEYLMIKNQTIAQFGANKWAHSLSETEKAKLIHEHLETYSRTQYKLKQRTEELRKKTIVCQRENSFFIDTVRKFRDRRYRYKREQKDHNTKLKDAQQKLDDLTAKGFGASNDAQSYRREIDTQIGLIILKESLQLAHKCILNSFYGYAMRKGSRWYSLEMAAAVTHTGANIIGRARSLIEMIGFVLELDTDGIWCCLPSTFPETYTFSTDKLVQQDASNSSRKGITVSFSYPGTMLNAITRIQNTNSQYLINTTHLKSETSHASPAASMEQKGLLPFSSNSPATGYDANDLVSLLCVPQGNLSRNAAVVRSTTVASSKAWKRVSECSIEFEVDGPYSCMILSAAREEGVRIKKKYAVFDLEGKLSELKGFELKRRGELQIIKSFQTRVFAQFLKGLTLEEAYYSAAKIANTYLDIIYTKGSFLTDQQLILLISEASTLKNSLNSIPKNRKSTSITCARRMSNFLDPLFATVDGLSVEYVISKLPEGLPVSERAVPVQIFSSPENVRAKFLRQWTGTQKTDNSMDIRELLDWDYYLTRLSGAIYKIIVVPSGLQGMSTSPVQRIAFPDWLAHMQTQTQSKQLSNILQKYLRINEEGVSKAELRTKVKGRKKAIKGSNHDGMDLPAESTMVSSSSDTESSNSQDPNMLHKYAKAEGESDDEGDSGPSKDDHNPTITDQQNLKNSDEEAPKDKEGALVLFPKTSAEFPRWFAKQTQYWNSLLVRGVIGKPYYMTHDTILNKKGTLFQQLQATRLKYSASNDFHLKIVTASVLPSGKVACICINQNNIAKQIIIGTCMQVYLGLKTPSPQSAIDELSSPTLTITDVTNRNFILPDMAQCAQLLRYEMSTDTYIAERASLQILEASNAIISIYEKSISGSFRFLVELPSKLHLPETHESRQLLGMGEIPYSYLVKHAMGEETKNLKEPNFIFSYKESEPPSYPVGYVVETEECIISLLPDGKLIIISIYKDQNHFELRNSKQSYLLRAMKLFIQLLEHAEKRCITDTSKSVSSVPLESLLKYTIRHLLMKIQRYNIELKDKTLEEIGDILQEVVIWEQVISKSSAVSALITACDKSKNVAVLFWRSDCPHDQPENASFNQMYFKEHYFVIAVPSEPCEYTNLLLPVPQHALQLANATINEPEIKRPPVLSACSFATEGINVDIVKSLADLVLDTIVAHYISCLFNIPINLILDKSAYQMIISPPFLSIEGQKDCTITTLLLDTMLAREYKKNNMLLPESVCTTLDLSADIVVQRSGMYHGYSLMFNVRNTLVQILMNYLLKESISITEMSNLKVIMSLPIHIVSSGRLRILAKLIKNVITSSAIATPIKQEVSDTLERYLFTNVSLFYSSGVVKLIYEELKQFYAAYNNVLAENGYVLVYADTARNIIASEKLNSELLLNSYRNLLHIIKGITIFQVYELPSVDTVYSCLCACPMYDQSTKDLLQRQFQNNIFDDGNTSNLISKSKSTPISLASPITPKSIPLFKNVGVTDQSFLDISHLSQIVILRHLAFINFDNYFGYLGNFDTIIGHCTVQNPLPKELKHVFQAAMSAYSLFMLSNLSGSVKSVAAAETELRSVGLKFLDFIQSCTVGVVTSVEGGQTPYENEIITVQTNTKTKDALRLLTDLFHVYYIKNATVWPSEVTSLYAKTDLSKPMDDISPGIYFMRTFMHFLSLDERISEAVRTFCWGILSGMGVHTPLDNRLKYGELLPECKLSTILCSECNRLNCLNVTCGKISTCYFCNKQIENKVLEQALILRLTASLDKYFTQGSVTHLTPNLNSVKQQEKASENMSLNALLHEVSIVQIAGELHELSELINMCIWWHQQLRLPATIT